MGRRTLFVSDLDGTLLNGDSHISDESARLLNEALARGALFSVATARTPSTVSVILENVNVDLPQIVMTGAALWNPASGSFLRPETLPAEQAGQLLRIFQENRLPVFTYTLEEDKIHIYHSGPLSTLESDFIAERDQSRYKIFHIGPDGNSIFPEPLKDVVLFYAMQPSPQVEHAYRIIKEKVACNPLFYHDIFGEDIGIIEVFSEKASKAQAMEWLKKESGADFTVAFGDNINDIPMLREADLAVAVENAKPEVLEVADIIIGKNTDNAVARFILEATEKGLPVFSPRKGEAGTR